MPLGLPAPRRFGEEHRRPPGVLSFVAITHPRPVAHSPSPRKERGARQRGRGSPRARPERLRRSFSGGLGAEPPSSTPPARQRRRGHPPVLDQNALGAPSAGAWGQSPHLQHLQRGSGGEVTPRARPERLRRPFSGGLGAEPPSSTPPARQRRRGHPPCSTRTPWAPLQRGLGGRAPIFNTSRAAAGERLPPSRGSLLLSC